MRLRRREISSYRLYLILGWGTAFLSGAGLATVTVYWVTSGKLNPLQLLHSARRSRAATSCSSCRPDCSPTWLAGGCAYWLAFSLPA